MRSLLCLIVLALTANAWSQPSQSASIPVPASQKFAGTWWSKADVEERSGFLNGTADCLTWTAHKKGFNATPEQLLDKITEFYRVHPESVNLSIIDVWLKVADKPKAGNEAKEQGEIWKNAHWYLNGEWWMQVSEVQQLGFVEGYLWCLKTQISAPSESYSGSAGSYRRKIDAFVKKNPRQGKEALAITLRRYRDLETATTPK